MSAAVEHSECLAYLATLATNSLDSVVTDPPYELNFMGRDWDRSGIANQVELWRAVYRVMKPGAHLLAFGGTRTSHRMVCAIEDAGFEIRDSLHWLYGSGFPKSKNVGDGVGTALKPAHEPICLARKPLAKTVAATIAAYGTGGINVEVCRVAGPGGRKWVEPYGGYWVTDSDAKSTLIDNPDGRWPPNVLLTHSATCVPIGARKVQSAGWREKDKGLGYKGNTLNGSLDATFNQQQGKSYADADGTETIAAYDCATSCPVAALDRQSGANVGGHSGNRNGYARTGKIKVLNTKFVQSTIGNGYGDTGGASRFYPILNYDPQYDNQALYCAKASKRERGAGNHHPCVKPVALCRWCVRLVCPPGGTVLDPFAGSGSVGVACVLEGFNYVGCDQDAEYVEIANRRIMATQPALIGV